ncbi:MAG TPA: hypothetical protein VGM37_03770 [Armatimonadota bacterium]
MSSVEQTRCPAGATFHPAPNGVAVVNPPSKLEEGVPSGFTEQAFRRFDEDDLMPVTFIGPGV